MAKQRSVEGQIPIRKSQDALALIHKERLEAVVAVAEAVARELSESGVPIDRVDIERMTDPEIENLVRLGFTVWMPGTAMGQASTAWDRLLDQARRRVSKLGPEESRKLSELVSIGVDVE
jgi:hypothetical protein